MAIKKIAWALLAFGVNAYAAQGEDSTKDLLALYQAGKYWDVGSRGLSLLKTGSWDDEFRFAVANSLAWTGRYPEAIAQYQAISDPKLSNSAKLGLANVYRWSGRADLAFPLYRELMREEPGNPDVIDGMTRIQRQIRPATKITFATAKDTNAVVQNGATLSYRFRGQNLALSYELTMGLNRQTQNPLLANQRDVGFSIQHDAFPLAPRIEFSVQQSPRTKAFASVRLKLDESADHLSVGYVNWGKMAFFPQALIDGLGAYHLGVDGSRIFKPGTFSLIYDAYRISDGNMIQDTAVRFYPSWPLQGPEIRYFVGLSGRFANRNDPRYWSPQNGYLSTDIGVSGEWTTLDWDLGIYAQRGFRAGGEAQNSYALGTVATRHIGKDWAASINASLNSNMRVGAYRSRSLSFGIERLW